MIKVKTQPRRVNFARYDSDLRVLDLSARLLTDDTIARATGLTKNQVTYRRGYAKRHGIAVSKTEIRNGRGIGKFLLAATFDSAKLEAAIKRDLQKAGLFR
jgi:hypothetical protein